MSNLFRNTIVIGISMTVWLSVVSDRARGADPLREQALRTAKLATTFLTENIADHGGYLWRYSSDLKVREGEGVVDTATVWVQPPGTPAVGEAFVRLYQATSDPQFLDAAMAAAGALRHGQMRSGGWQAHIEFDPDRRAKWAYRTEPPGKKRKDQSSLDDDKTQSSIRFLVQLDRATGFRDAGIHAMTTDALKGLMSQGQFENGGFPQVWMDQPPVDAKRPPIQASFPEQWPREYPGHGEYWHRYTLNDNLASTLMTTLILASETYDDPAYRDAAIRLADSLLLAQLPSPQRAWAQQYNQQMQPIWARKFEPPAVSGSESQAVIDTLMDVYQWTGDEKYLKPIRPAIDYLQRSRLSDGRLARFYELRTNRPLYFDRQYNLTYDDSDMPTHYAFKIGDRTERLRRRYQQVSGRGMVADDAREAWLDRLIGRREANASRIRKIVDAIDSRGAWVVDEPMRYHRHPGPSISMATTVDHLNRIADFLDASN
ncbi:pectate lyase [Crateriforma conspicua]|uniref:Pectic acid lyase n=1 Tax=Crateriforma conspicua TaxID=2527996 RepID=A0A5C5Y0I7_9PLAN|nr:pectate lyase [Crateriforma conspicua]TWT68468.1 Pectic acid lyase [Crateriforma conspicua]